MLLSEQHERLVRMIKESIGLMCKSSLTYDLELNVEGLLGITLDKKDIFLVNINESFPSQCLNRTPSSASKRQKQQDTTDVKDEEFQSPSSSKRKRARRRSRNSTEVEPSASQDDGLFGSQRHHEADPGPHDNSELYSDPLKEESQLDFANITVKQEVEDDSNAEAGDFGFTPETFGEEGPYSSSLPLAIPTDVSPDNGWSSQVHDSDQLAATTTTTETTSSSRREGTGQAVFPTLSEAHIQAEGAWLSGEPVVFRPASPDTGPVAEPPSTPTFECKFCGKAFGQKSSLKIHTDAIHYKRVHSCNTCQQTFTMYRALQRHIQAVHEKRTYQCTVCLRVFTRQDCLQKHFKKVHLEKLRLDSEQSLRVPVSLEKSQPWCRQSSRAHLNTSTPDSGPPAGTLEHSLSSFPKPHV